MSNGRLKLDDADFWTDAERTRPEITLELRQSEFKGVILDGPREVSLAERETCPLAGWWACDGYTDSVLRMPDALTVFSLDQRSHKLRRGVPLCLGSRPKRADVPKLSRAELERMTTREMFGFDLRQAVDLPWKGGTQVVAAVVREHLSEVLTIELNASGAGGYDDPAVAEFLAAQEQGAIPNPPPVSPPAAAPANALEADPPEAIPNYREAEGSPEVPAEAGVALAAERVIVAKAGVSAVLRGSFRLPAAKQERKRPDPETEETPELGDAEATAIVPIHLIVTGSADPNARVMTLRVPSTDAFDLEAEAVEVTGHFNVDLFAEGVVTRFPQTYFIYVAAGSTISGPTPVAVLSEESLPYHEAAS